jgi:hypothetical protein
MRSTTIGSPAKWAWAFGAGVRGVVVVVFLVLAVLFVAWPRIATSADRPAPSCQQWEVALASPTHLTIDARSLPEAGKPVTEASPPGWEPFAFTPTGQLVYRRCAR